MSKRITICSTIATIIAIVCIAHQEQKPNTYVVIRANCNDTTTIKADTFRVYPRENKAYFVTNEEAIAVVDSVNQIKRK